MYNILKNEDSKVSMSTRWVSSDMTKSIDSLNIGGYFRVV